MPGFKGLAGYPSGFSSRADVIYIHVITSWPHTGRNRMSVIHAALAMYRLQVGWLRLRPSDLCASSQSGDWGRRFAISSRRSANSSFESAGVPSLLSERLTVANFDSSPSLQTSGDGR
jgi:hypothetical protein